MTRPEAIEFIKRSSSNFFRYGDLSYSTGREDALADIQNMEDDAWNDGEIFEEEQC